MVEGAEVLAGASAYDEDEASSGEGGHPLQEEVFGDVSYVSHVVDGREIGSQDYQGIWVDLTGYHGNRGDYQQPEGLQGSPDSVEQG